MRSTYFILISLLALFLSSPVVAQVPHLVNYEGMLTDDGEIPLTGDYDLTFRIYPDSTAGAAVLWTEIHPVVLVDDGFFHAILGSITAIHDSLFQAEERWMGITVDDDPEISPRMRITSVPWALKASVADTALVVAGGLPDGHSLNADDGDPVDAVYVESAGHVGIGTTTPFGHLHVIGSDTLGTLIVSPDEPGAGGNSNVLLAEDDEGLYGIRLKYDGPANDFEVWGKVGANEYGPHLSVDRNVPHVKIEGSSTAAFYMNNTWDNTVHLPTGAISAIEIWDEPGVASELEGINGIALDGTVQTILTRSFTIPADGYVLVMGTAQARVNHSGGYTSRANFGVSDVADSLPINQDVALAIPASVDTGSFDFPLSVHGLFEKVTAGLWTFYFLAEETDGNFLVYDMQLTLVYLPTAYGDVTSTFAGGDPVRDGEARAIPSVSQSDISREKAEAMGFNATRVQEELAEVRARLEALEREVQSEEP